MATDDLRDARPPEERPRPAAPPGERDPDADHTPAEQESGERASTPGGGTGGAEAGMA